VRAYLKARFRCWVPIGAVAKRISKVKVLGSCAVRVPSKQAKVRCLVPVRVYPSKDKMVWFGAVLSAMVGCKVKVLG
jgi:hypothetical protein